MRVNIFLLSARHIGIIFHIRPMPIFTFKAIIGRFRYQSDCDDDDDDDDDDDCDGGGDDGDCMDDGDDD